MLGLAGTHSQAQLPDVVLIGVTVSTGVLSVE